MSLDEITGEPTKQHACHGWEKAEACEQDTSAERTIGDSLLQLTPMPARA
jgi:hypothetical protein